MNYHITSSLFLKKIAYFCIEIFKTLKNQYLKNGQFDSISEEREKLSKKSDIKYPKKRERLVEAFPQSKIDKWARYGRMVAYYDNG